MPFLSIIIPTYNCETYLEESLDSVLKQLPEDYELIIVDDGSQEATRQILARYAHLDILEHSLDLYRIL